MTSYKPVARVIDLIDPAGDTLLNVSNNEAAEAVASGDPERVRAIDGQFAIVQQCGQIVRMARSIGRPMRYFLAKQTAGPCLIVAERIDEIADCLKREGLFDQFHPSYTRMVPAHHLLEIALVGCPDPNPVCRRFFAPERNQLPADVDAIGKAYIGAVAEECRKWLDHIDNHDTPGGRGWTEGKPRMVDDRGFVKTPAPATQATREPIGVLFSGGIDSGSLFLVLHHLLLERGESPARLKAFTLRIDGNGADAEQAARFLDELDLGLFLECIDVSRDQLDYRDAVRAIEDYKPLDVQSALMALALCRGIRKRYPDWTYLTDGDGGDENLKDYPIEENPELTIRSVLNNTLLYQEGWGVDAIKHSLVYSGGQSRGHVRTFAPARQFNFRGFSPYALPNVIAVAEGIPFIELTDWQHDKLYDLKGEIVRRGVEVLTGLTMPVFPKRRFQQGVVDQTTFASLFPDDPAEYRSAFLAIHE